MRKLKWLFMVFAMIVLFGRNRVDARDVPWGQFDSGDGFYYIKNEDGTLTISDYYKNEETVTFPSEIDGQKVTAIQLDDDGLWERDTVKHIIIPDGYTDILCRINYSSYGAFYACVNLETVSLPKTLKTIGAHAFSSCSNLNQLVLPKSLTSIGDGAFLNCVSLNKIEVPDSVTSIGDNAFNLIWPTQKIPIYANPGSYAHTYAQENYVPFSCMEHAAIVFDSEIPATCTKEGLTAGSHCSDCNNIITKGEAIPAKGHTIVPEPEIPATCQHSGGVKGHCSVCGEDTGWIRRVSATKHKIITIYTPPTCTQFGNTETYCEMCGERNIDEDGHPLPTSEKEPLQPHTYDDGVIDINKNKKLFTCTVCGAKKYIHLTNSDFILDSGLKYTVIKPRILAFAGTTNSKSRITIPNTVTYNGKTFNVAAVDDNALKGNKKVTNIVIGKNVTTIGKNAFCGCTRLNSVSIGENVKIINAEAFKGCGKLKNITIYSTKLSKVGKNALKGIHPRAKIRVPVKKLKNYQGKFKKKGQKPTVKIIT